MSQQNYSFSDFEEGSAPYIILHAREREQNGLFPELPYKGIRDPKVALKHAIMDIAHVNPHGGDHLNNVSRVMALRSTVFEIRVSAVFNDIQLIAEPGMTPEEIIKQYYEQSERNSEKWNRSMKGAINRREDVLREKKNEERKLFVEKLLSEEEIEVEGGKETIWAETKRINGDDPYGRAALRYTKSWALAMQITIRENGNLTKATAEELSHEVDFDGITGFQHGCAMNLLLSVWKYRFELADVYGINLEKIDNPKPEEE